MVSNKLLKDHRVFNFIGVDFLMDENLNVYLLDAEVVPSIAFKSNNM